MPLTADPSLALTPSAEQGFTLIELLVSLVVSIVVLGAILATLEFALRQETNITDRVDANQIGRTALSTIIAELHSSCTGFGATAIQAPASKPTEPLASTGPVDLWFLSSFGNSSSEEAVLKGVTEHDIHWVSTGKSNTGRTLGTLTDYAFKSEGGSSPNWTFPELKVANAKAKVLAMNVIPLEIAGVSTIFQYSKYNNKGEELALKSSELPTATANKEVAKVTTTFTQAPTNGDTRLGRTANLSDSAVLRFNSTQVGAEVVNNPCA
jgi:type II secretory pathway pseudopilin PulG